jgi:glycosyltransferase involved in cell wall biosynthesis
MIILELNFEKSWRGGEQQTLFNAKGFLNQGFEVHLICRKNSPLEKKALAENIIVHAFKSIWGVFFFLIKSGKKFQVMHAQGSKILTYCILSKPFHKSKILFTRRVNFVQSGFFTKLKYTLTDKIVAISSSVKNIVSTFTSRNDIVLISDIVVEKTLNNQPVNDKLKQLHLDNKIIIGTIAALSLEKNPFGTIEAIKMLKEKRNDFVFLHFGEGVLMEKMKQLIEAYQLSDNYILMGFEENVTDYFSKIEIFVMNSNNEGLCSSVLDSFLYKVPVISTLAGGLSDLIKEDRGIICEMNNAKMLSEKMNFLIENPVIAEKLVTNAYHYVTKNHGLDFITAQYVQLIDKMINNNTRN